MITAVLPEPVHATRRTDAVRRNPTPRSAVMGAILLGTITFVNEAVFRIADAEHYSFDWQTALRLATCGVCGLYGLAHFRRAIHVLTHGAGLLVFAFGCWTVVILPFAVNFPFSAAAVVSLWCAMLFTAAVKEEVPPRWIMAAIATSLVVFMIGSWFVYYAIAPLGREVQNIGGGVEIVRFGGLQHPNGLGRQCALAVAMLLVVGLERFAHWKTLAAPMAFAVITGFATDSRTAMLAMGTLFFVAFFRSLPIGKALLALVLAGPLVVGVAGLGISTGFLNVKVERMAEKLSRDGDSKELYSMNSRTEVWNYAFKKFTASPWAGCGYGCQRFIMKDNFFPTHHAHNTLLNVALGTGLFGAGLLLWQLLVVIRRAFVVGDPFTSLLLVNVVIAGFADSVMFGPVPESHTILWWLALFLPAGLTQSTGTQVEQPLEMACQLN